MVQHFWAILALGLPLIGSNMAQMGLHVTDTIMLGWYGVPQLAAVVLAASTFFILFIFGSGFAYAVIGRVATALGSGDETQARRDTRMALWLSLIYSVAVMPILWFSGPILRLLGQEDALSHMVETYLRVAGWGMFPALITAVLRGYLSAQERTQVVLWVTLAGVVVNVGFNWVLIFGNLGAPEMGLQGAAVASLSVQILTCVALCLYAGYGPSLRHVALFQNFWRPDPEAFVDVAKMGLPIGLTSVSEGGLFQASALMMGWIGAVELAAHGIALELASMVFMLHSGLSQAATVRAGRAHGAKDLLRLRRGAVVAIALSLLAGVITVTAFIAMPTPLVALFVDSRDPKAAELIDLGVKFLMVAALFQLFDAAQVMALGLLRGVQDTRVPMIYAVTSYWIVGIPASYVLAFPLGLGGVGLWLGLAAGLAVAGALMMHRFWSRDWI
ncbi:MATE family efflux transporter [Thioclava sp. SK-1]|nr:MATE family efflux transporter [Thioclava sp. SK-1]